MLASRVISTLITLIHLYRIRRQALPNDGLPIWPRGRSIIHGDFIVANHTSYIDIIYFYFRYGFKRNMRLFFGRFTPVFVEVLDTDRGLVRKSSALECILRCGGPDRVGLKNAGSVMTLSQLSAEAKLQRLGPIVLFPEIATSNGRGILKMDKNIFPESIVPQLHIIAIK